MISTRPFKKVRRFLSLPTRAVIHVLPFLSAKDEAHTYRVRAKKLEIDNQRQAQEIREQREEIAQLR